MRVYEKKLDIGWKNGNRKKAGKGRGRREIIIIKEVKEGSKTYISFINETIT